LSAIIVRSAQLVLRRPVIKHRSAPGHRHMTDRRARHRSPPWTRGLRSTLSPPYLRLNLETLREHKPSSRSGLKMEKYKCHCRYRNLPVRLFSLPHFVTVELMVRCGCRPSPVVCSGCIVAKR